MPQGPTDLLAWVTIGLFVAGVLAHRRDERVGRAVTAVAWVVFGAFWAILVPHFAFEQQSIVEGVLSALAVPVSAYTGYVLWTGRETLMTLSKGVAVMGLVYLPASTLPWLSTFLVETVTRQIEWGIGLLGYETTVLEQDGVRNTFEFESEAGLYRTHIVFACTGIGSMTIFAGLVAAVDAPLRRKARAMAIVIPIIWVLNIVRNVFIALAHGYQWFAQPYLQEPVMFLFGESNPELVSFLVADRIIAQTLSVVALIAILGLVVRELPELKAVVNDVLYLLTGSDYGLGDDGPPPRGGVRADGAGAPGGDDPGALDAADQGEREA
jgi:archaeosortase A (PGF-CTERM-specific)